MHGERSLGEDLRSKMKFLRDASRARGLALVSSTLIRPEECLKRGTKIVQKDSKLNLLLLPSHPHCYLLPPGMGVSGHGMWRRVR